MGSNHRGRDILNLKERGKLILRMTGGKEIYNSNENHNRVNKTMGKQNRKIIIQHRSKFTSSSTRTQPKASLTIGFLIVILMKGGSSGAVRWRVYWRCHLSAIRILRNSVNSIWRTSRTKCHSLQATCLGQVLGF